MISIESKCHLAGRTLSVGQFWTCMHFHFQYSRMLFLQKQLSRGVLKNSVKFTGKHLYQSHLCLFLNKVAGLVAPLCCRSCGAISIEFGWGQAVSIDSPCFELKLFFARMTRFIVRRGVKNPPPPFLKKFQNHLPSHLLNESPASPQISSIYVI